MAGPGRSRRSARSSGAPLASAHRTSITHAGWRTIMNELVTLASSIGHLLTDRKETIAVAESSAGGLISAALLAVPGASGYFLGGPGVITRTARSALLDIPESALEGMRPSTEPYALLLARTARTRFNSTWSIAETGATG